MSRPGEWIESWCAEELGAPLTEVTPLDAGAGRRRYWRVVAGTSRAVLMEARAEDPAILPPQLRGEAPELPFVAVTRLLARHRIPVPELYAMTEDQAWLLLEDLGSVHLLDLSPAERARRYPEAIDILAAVHDIANDGRALPFERSFDREWIEFELELFLSDLPAARRRELAGGFSELAGAIDALPRCLCLRDYQSSNLMIDAEGVLRVIDYQDALMAPPELDLVSLLWDSYVAPAPDREALLERYSAATGRPSDSAALGLLLVQRKCKDASRFRRLLKRKRDARYEAALGAATAAALEGVNRLPKELSALAPPLGAALESLAP